MLERAFVSTHPDSEPMFFAVLEAYKNGMGKDWTAVERRLEDGKPGPIFATLPHSSLQSASEDAKGVWLGKLHIFLVIAGLQSQFLHFTTPLVEGFDPFAASAANQCNSHTTACMSRACGSHTSFIIVPRRDQGPTHSVCRL